MRIVFTDSFYFIAQLNATDEAHVKATAFTSAFEGKLLTTDWVLVEVGDAFSRPPNRARATTKPVVSHAEKRSPATCSRRRPRTRNRQSRYLLNIATNPRRRFR
jgi:hypothetical protein